MESIGDFFFYLSYTKNGWTPLHHSAYYAHLRAVEVLIRNKCDVDMLNKVSDLHVS